MNSYHQRLTSLNVPLLMGALVVLAGCSAPLASRDAGAARKPNDPYTLTVALTGTDTPAGVAERYGGTVLVWEPGDYALLGLDAPPLGPQAAAAEVSSNADVFYAGGEMTAVMNGRSRVWAGGRSRVWAGGRSRV